MLRPDEIEFLVRVRPDLANSVVHEILGTVRFSWYVFDLKKIRLRRALIDVWYKALFFFAFKRLKCQVNNPCEPLRLLHLT